MAGSDATFATLAATSSPEFRLPLALDVILQPSTLLPTLLQYIDLPTLAALRSLSLFRERIAELVREQNKATTNNSSSAVSSTSIPHHILDHLRASSASQSDIFLRNCLTETTSIEPRKEPVTEIQADEAGPPNASNLSKAMIRKSATGEKVIALNRLGVLALASSPIATETALQNLILQGVPGHDIDDETKGRVYERIARNEAASEATLLLLVEEVEKLASNGFIPSSCSRTFHSVALNRNASPKVLSKLLEATIDDHTQQNIAKNPNASSKNLSFIIRESYPQRIVTLKHTACHPNTPSTHLESFAKDKNEYIRGAVASNPKAPPHLLSHLSTDTDFFVRLNTAANTSTPKEALLRLCENGGVTGNDEADDDDDDDDDDGEEDD